MVKKRLKKLKSSEKNGLTRNYKSKEKEQIFGSIVDSKIYRHFLYTEKEEKIVGMGEKEGNFNREKAKNVY